MQPCPALIVTATASPFTRSTSWGHLAKPASAIHWQDGRSAKELAMAWTGGSGPAVLAKLLDRHRLTADLQITKATAEAQIAFDSLPGGRRNHDLLIKAEGTGGPTIIGLEGKADETFGPTINAYARAAREEVRARGANQCAAALKGLLADLAATTLRHDPQVGKLRVPVLAVAGTLAAAQPGSQAAFVVHEFKTSKTAAAKRNANATAIAAFVRDIFGAVVPAREVGGSSAPSTCLLPAGQRSRFGSGT